MRRAKLLLSLLLLAYLGHAGVRHLTDPEYASLWGGVDFGVHEFGHLLFGFFGEWLTVAGGSITQLLVPVLVAALFWKQRERLGVAVCGCWLAISLARVAVYMADARVLELDLVSFSEDASGHDWNYLFGSVGLLAHDTSIARLVRHFGWLVLAVSLAFGARTAWLASRPARQP